MFEHFLERVHLRPELPDDPGVGILVHHRVVHDAFGTVSISDNKTISLYSIKLVIRKVLSYLNVDRVSS